MDNVEKLTEYAKSFHSNWLIILQQSYPGVGVVEPASSKFEVAQRYFERCDPFKISIKTKPNADHHWIDLLWFWTTPPNSLFAKQARVAPQCSDEIGNLNWEKKLLTLEQSFSNASTLPEREKVFYEYSNLLIKGSPVSTQEETSKVSLHFAFPPELLKAACNRALAENALAYPEITDKERSLSHIYSLAMASIQRWEICDSLDVESIRGNPTELMFLDCLHTFQQFIGEVSPPFHFVTITKNGRVYVDGKVVQLSQVERTLLAIFLLTSSKGTLHEFQRNSFLKLYSNDLTDANRTFSTIISNLKKNLPNVRLKPRTIRVKELSGIYFSSEAERITIEKALKAFQRT